MSQKKADIAQPKKINAFLYFTVFAANLSAFTLGISFCWSSPAIPRLNGLIDPINNPLGRNITEAEESWIASLLPLGAATSACISGYGADQIGRKTILMVSSIPSIIGYICSTLANRVSLFYLGRFLCGLSCGTVFTVIPMYVGEISEKHNRGFLGCLLVFGITSGNLFLFTTAPYCTIRLLSFINIFPPFVFLLVFGLFAPESPYYFVAKNQKEKAYGALLKLRNNSGEIARKELLVIEESVEDSYSKRTNFAGFLRDNKRSICLGVGLVSFQQFSGINAIFFYMQSIFEDSQSGLSSDLSTILVGVIQFLGAILATITIDKFGRRVLLITSSIGMTISQLIFSLYFFYEETGPFKNFRFLPVLCIVTFVLMYTIGFGPLAFAMIGEIFPLHVKAISSTVSIFCCLTCVFCITTIFPHVIELVGMGTSFAILSGICCLGGCFVYFRVPETKGKTLQEVEAMLKK